jgi:ankyrin repeat protein
LDKQNKYGDTPLASAIFHNNRGCAERLLDAGAKISNVKKDIEIPDWFTSLVNQRKRVKEALKVVFALSRPLIGKDVAKILISMTWETRWDERWRVSLPCGLSICEKL